MGHGFRVKLSIINLTDCCCLSRIAIRRHNQPIVVSC